MPELPQKKVGIVACSGEELPEGTVTRLAALMVLEQLRPADTVTICLPLFLAGGEGDRAFARFYPTIAIDGCDKRCAARATELHSGKPAANVVVTEVVKERGLGTPEGLRELNQAGRKAVGATAEIVAANVDECLRKVWSRREGAFASREEGASEAETVCACVSGVPTTNVIVDGLQVPFVALDLIFEKLWKEGKRDPDLARGELLETVKIYNPLPDDREEGYSVALVREFEAYCRRKESTP